MDLQATRLELDSGASAASSGFRVQIVVEPFDGQIRGLTLNVARELSIGRDPGCDVRLAGRFVSRRHALVRATAEGLEIEDTSSNGTLADGSLLRRSRRRVANECILIVGCVRLWLQRSLPE